ncbi:MAG TPA: hypothetical protein VJ866_22050 [Pyrinomonadaceae bacterium]|nr:hypothetical protein [Pyrinomonadaceae bacterium]
MKTRIPRLVFALSAVLALACAQAAAVGARRQQTAAARAARTVLFAVEKYEANVTMEPIVIYERGAYAKPPVDDEAGSQAFTREFFRAGRQFRLLSGGGDAGTVTVKKAMEPGCVFLAAEVSVETQARLGGRVQALATDSSTLGRGASSRRAPTEAERARAIELARAAYAKNGAPAALVGKMEVANLTATDLDRDGREELIGSFVVEKKSETAGDAWTLFLIIEPEGGTFKTAWEWFHHGFEGEYADRRYVDQIDLDGDGVGEVVVEGSYYESNDYIIYKKQQGRWRPVYQGGGGGC